MRLFLASSSKALIQINQKYPMTQKRVLFITDGGDPYRGSEWGDLTWIQEDKEIFHQLGACIQEVQLKDYSENEFRQLLEVSDIIHVCGGSCGYLAQVFAEDKKGAILKKALESNKIIYSGVSAGAMIAAPSVELYSRFSLDPFEIRYTHYQGLDLVSFLIVPHANHPEIIPYWRNSLSYFPESISTFWLHDTQALWIENQKIEFLDSSLLIHNS